MVKQPCERTPVSITIRLCVSWSPAGHNGVREENCIAEPSKRVKIIDTILGNTREAQALGYSVRQGELQL